MSGVKTHNRIEERNLRLLQFMRDGTPISIICELEGIQHDYCRKICNRLAKLHGINYQPVNIMSKVDVTPDGVTDESRRLRSALAARLFELGEDRHSIAQKTGITTRCQKYARERPFNHNWTLSQLEKLAVANDANFSEMMLEALLGGERYRKVVACLNR